MFKILSFKFCLFPLVGVQVSYHIVDLKKSGYKLATKLHFFPTHDENYSFWNKIRESDQLWRQKCHFQKPGTPKLHSFTNIKHSSLFVFESLNISFNSSMIKNILKNVSKT